MGPRQISRTLLCSGVLFLVLGTPTLWPGTPGCLHALLEGKGPIDKTSPVYLKASELLRASPLLAERLGHPVAEGEVIGGITQPRSSPEGQLLGAPFALFTVEVYGPSGKGKVHGVANLVGEEWKLSALSFTPAGSRERINLLPPPQPEAVRVRGSGTIYLVPLGKPVLYTLDGLQEYLQRRFEAKVELLPWLPLPLGVWHDSYPHAVEADKLIEYMKGAHPEVANDPEVILIGITERQMAADAFGWSSSFTIRRQGRLAVISTQLMGPWTPLEEANPEVVQSRLRKVLLKDIGLLYLKLPLSSDPTSVLLANLDSTTTIDLMTEEFLGARGLWRSDLSEEAPCISVTRFPDGRYAWLDAYDRLPPSDTHLQRFSYCPGFGMFAQQQIDFFFPEPFPLALRRLYRTQDDRSRAFGVGNNHSLDIFLVGSAPRYVELVLEDGGRIRFERDTPPPGRHNVFFRAVGQGHEFAGATMEWNGHGWDLTRRDGWVFVFPASQQATRSQQAALTGIHQSDDLTFRFERDSNGNLLRVTTPGGESLVFEYDSSERIRRISDSRGRWVGYRYDREGRLSRATDSAGETAAYAYDSKGRMATVEIPAGRVFLKNEYDDAGWLVRQTLADGGVFQYSYIRKDGDDKPEQITD